MRKNRQPDCPDGHGPMERQPGLWAVQGIKRAEEAGKSESPDFLLTGDGLALEIWTCPECSLARLYSDDQR